MTPLAFFDIGFGEMVVVGIVALLLFGGRLPEVMRSLGGAYRTFRRGFDDLSRNVMKPDAVARPPYRPTPPAPAATTFAPGPDPRLGTGPVASAAPPPAPVTAPTAEPRTSAPPRTSDAPTRATYDDDPPPV